MSQRFISVSMGIYSSDQTAFRSFSPKKHLKHPSFVMETALRARLFFGSDLDLGLRFEMLKGVIL